MSTPVQPTQSATTRGGAARIIGVLAMLSGVLAIVLIVLGVVGLSRVATPNMQGFNPGATVAVSSSGASIFARSDADRTQTVCTASDGGSAITLERPTSEFAVDVSGSDFYEVARTPDSLTPGSYQLVCDGTTAALYVGPAAPTTSASGLLGPGSLIGGVVLALLALGLGVLALLLRGSRRKPVSGGGGYQHGSGVAQPGYTSPYAHDPYAHDPGTASQPSGPPSQQGPYGQQPEQNYYAQPPVGAPASGDQAPSPPPHPSWTTGQSEPTQAIAYGAGHYAPTESPPADEAPADDDVDKARTTSTDDTGPERPTGNPYPPLPPPQ